MTKDPVSTPPSPASPVSDAISGQGEASPPDQPAVQRDKDADARDRAVLSLLFAPGCRPSMADVQAWLATSEDAARSLSLVHTPPLAEGWCEVLSHGLSFDLVGLAPAAATPLPEIIQSFALPPRAPLPEGEAISLVPGAHLSGGESLLPVVRALLRVGVGLASLPGVIATIWRPAGTAMEPAYFARICGKWLEGGAFPALGLTALQQKPGGIILTNGMSFFTGQELRIGPLFPGDPAHAGKIAVRLIHSLVGEGPVKNMRDFTGPQGERLTVEPSAEGRFVRVWQNRS
ncbi:hypothetical protein GTZ99_07310 [Novosphingobium sp. FSY-8]|uniref:DUF4261 domain-containing protein n=1 Tax=Novosphingobium ovatum TaxID=1908523 RepID=A0ABW9XCW6_9SPHN|nr:hypothetical protein [Novosphingobium ovatum]NBC36365.1 hypothetical protein [Novosphingobium ovatum]